MKFQTFPVFFFFFFFCYLPIDRTGACDETKYGTGMDGPCDDRSTDAADFAFQTDW